MTLEKLYRLSLILECEAADLLPSNQQYFTTLTTEKAA